MLRLKKREPLRFSFSFLAGVFDSTPFAPCAKEFAYPLRRSTSSLVRRSKRISSRSEYLYASIKEKRALAVLFFSGAGDENYILAKQEGVLLLGVQLALIALFVLPKITSPRLARYRPRQYAHIARRGVKLACKPQVQISSHSEYLYTSI